MSPQPASPPSQSPSEGRLYIVGKNVTHTIAPQMHNFIAQHLLSRPSWTFAPKESDSVHDALATFRSPGFVGGVVTMPYKTTIMPLLDELDELALRLNACNGVYLTREGKLCGTNTDWVGIRGCLVNAEAGEGGRGRPACIVGAGGASRAAVYALWAELGCGVVYIINRDREEVEALTADVQRMAALMKTTGPEIIHLQSVAQATSITSSEGQSPYYIVGTVPDFEPSSPSEILARDMLEVLLRDTSPKGVLLDMCFKPRVTRHIKMARKYGWSIVEGTEIIGHQIERQWWLWTGQGTKLTMEQQEQAWGVLREAAEASTAINF